MRPPTAAALVLSLGIGSVVVLAAGCGGSSSAPAVQTTPAPSGSAIVSGGRFVANGSKGVTFTFAIGPGVPAGETGVVTVLPTPPPCVSPDCMGAPPLLDGFQLSVGPQPLPVADFVSVALGGVQGPFAVSMLLQDTTDSGAFTDFFFLAPTGGPIRIIDPASVRPVLTLVPNRLYAVSIYTLPFLPS